MYIVSACLAGFNTRFDGGNRLDERVRRLVLEGKAMAICPEQLAGLPTPRPQTEFESGDGQALLDGKARALTAAGADVGAALLKGAHEVLSIARLYGVEGAVMKDGSPSCGVRCVYAAGRRADGMGVASALLTREGIRVVTVDSL
jgi:uncharacterized protein YbbK (DUF523 family)